MEQIAKSDIFFFVTTIAVIAIAIALVIALIYIIEILRDIREVSGKARQESEEIIKEIGSLRQKVKDKSESFVAGLLTFISKVFKSKKRSKHIKS